MPSIDLMVHITYSHLRAGLSFRKIDEYFDIAKSTAHRWYNQCKNNFNDINLTDEVIDIIIEQKEKKKIKENEKNIINKNLNVLNFIKKSLSIQPFQTLCDLQGKIKNKFDVQLTLKVVSKFVKIIGFSKKEITRRLFNNNIKQHKLMRKQFRKFIKKIPQDDIICIDETGINRNIYSNSGYSKIGKRLIAYYSCKNIPEKNPILMAIDNKKIIDYVSQTKSFNGTAFTEFIKRVIERKSI